MNRPRLTLREFSYPTPGIPELAAPIGGCADVRNCLGCRRVMDSRIVSDEAGQRWTAITDGLAWWRLVMESERLGRDGTIDGTERRDDQRRRGAQHVHSGPRGMARRMAVRRSSRPAVEVASVADVAGTGVGTSV